MSESAPQPDPSPEFSGEEVQPFVITLPDDPSSGGDWYLWAAVLALISLVVFWPAINGNFLWDDDQYVTHNKALQDVAGLKEIWQIPPGTIQYYPLTFTLFWVEHQFWGNSPLGYRVVNLLLHAGAAILLWRILRRLKVPGAWAAAAIWAIHPLQAESVCWISECKNVLSGILALASALFYLEFAGLYDPGSNKKTWSLNADWQLYLIALGFFILAVLAKTAVVLLPVAVLVVLWWKGRLTLPRILGTVPMLIIGGALSLVTARLETDPNGSIRATGPGWDFSFAQRLMISGRDFWFYIEKLVAPVHQSFIYRRVLPQVSDGKEWLFLAGAVVVLVALIALVKKIGRGPAAAAICYVLLIFPALGFFNVFPFRFSFVADHFQYLAGIPIIVLGVGILGRILTGGRSVEVPGNGHGAAIAVLVAAVLLVLGWASWIRADVFSDSEKLWADVLQPEKNPNSWLAAYNLARSEQGDAAQTFDDAARLLQGGDSDTSKQEALAAIAVLDDSDQWLKKVLANPNTPADWKYRAHDQLAQNGLTRLRSPDSKSEKILPAALAESKAALASPEAAQDPLPHYTLGLVELNLAQTMQREAKSGKKPATRMNEVPATTQPYTAQEQSCIDLYKQSRANFRKADELSQTLSDSPTLGAEAARVQPLAALESGNIDWTLAEAAMEHGNMKEETVHSKDAVDDYAEAVRLNPRNAQIRYQLALALENRGDLTNAKAELLYILKNLDSYNAQAYNEIGRVILAGGPTSMAEFQAAVESFKAALKLNPNFAGAQRNLAMAMRMLASTRPSTRPATRPATRQSIEATSGPSTHP